MSEKSLKRYLKKLLSVFMMLIMVVINNSFTYVSDSTNGDVIDDVTGTIYHMDGSITYSNGEVKDAEGIIHYLDGSIKTPDGTRYRTDGVMISLGGIEISPMGETINGQSAVEKENRDCLCYDPKVDKWFFEYSGDDGSRKSYKDTWIKAKNSFGKEAWYVVDENGYMITGWFKSAGEYYYLSKDEITKGELVKGETIIDNEKYILNLESGVLESENLPIKNVRVRGAVNHEHGKDGKWKVYDTGERYYVAYFDMPDGSRLEVPPTGWYMIDTKYYYFEQYGIPKTGLIISDGKYYYLNEAGDMQEGGEIIIDNVVYVFDKATGACITMRYDNI